MYADNSGTSGSSPSTTDPVVEFKDTDYSEDGQTGEETHSIEESKVVDPAMERRVKRKLDMHLLPILVISYLLNSLDHSNMGNAKTDGLEKTLHMSGKGYSLALSVFYITYVLTGPSFGVISKIYGPHLILPSRTLGFGIMTLLVLVVKNLGGLCGIRIALGFFESGYLAIVIYYLTLFYRRGELAMRLAIVHCGQDLANALGGLFGYGLFQITGTSLASWRYLFLVEGCLTICLVPFMFWLLPASTDECKFLTATEKTIARERVQLDSSAILNEPFNFRYALTVFRHPTSWLFIFLEFCIGIPLQSVQNFTSEILKRFGYGTVTTQLYIVGPNLSAAVVLLILSYSSDRTRLRWPFITVGFTFTFIGFLVLSAIPDVAVHRAGAYFATFLMIWGVITPSVLVDAWLNNNIADESKRVLLTSIALPASNLMGVVSSNIFLTQDAPKYTPALAVSASMAGAGALLSAGMGLWMMYENRRRDRAQGVKVKPRDVPSNVLRNGPASPLFRWLI